MIGWLHLTWGAARVALAATLILSCGMEAASAQDIALKSKRAEFASVKADLQDAIIEKGLVVDTTGQIGRMLTRTGPDLGSAKAIYKEAEYMAFCSAKLSRAMMEADPANIGYCPYVVFYYERADEPGVVYVGYRPPELRGSDASRKALQEISRLLEDIVTSALK